MYCIKCKNMPILLNEATGLCPECEFQEKMPKMLVLINPNADIDRITNDFMLFKEENKVCFNLIIPNLKNILIDLDDNNAILTKIINNHLEKCSICVFVFEDEMSYFMEDIAYNLLETNIPVINLRGSKYIKIQDDAVVSSLQELFDLSYKYVNYLG